MSSEFANYVAIQGLPRAEVTGQIIQSQEAISETPSIISTTPATESISETATVLVT